MENIVDNVFLADLTYAIMVEYFDIMAYILKNFRCTLKLTKCILFGSKLEFVCIDVTNNVNLPAEKNMDAFINLSPPPLLLRYTCDHQNIWIQLPLYPNVRDNNPILPCPS